MAFVNRSDVRTKYFKGYKAAFENKLEWMEAANSRGEEGVEGGRGS